MDEGGRGERLVKGGEMGERSLMGKMNENENRHDGELVNLISI